MKKLRRKFYLMLLLGIGVTGIAGQIILDNYLPEFNFAFYPVIPVYFLCLGMILLAILKVSRNKTDHQILNIYLGTRVSKSLFTVFLMMLYVLLVKVQVKSFIITTFIFYLIYLGIETKFYFDFEKSLKADKKNDTHTT